MKTYASQKEAEAAVASVLEIARRAAEEHGVDLTVVAAAGIGGEERPACTVEAAFVGTPLACLDIAANALGAISFLCEVDFQQAGISKAIMWGHEHAPDVLRAAPPAGGVG